MPPSLPPYEQPTTTDEVVRVLNTLPSEERLSQCQKWLRAFREQNPKIDLQNAANCQKLMSHLAGFSQVCDELSKRADTHEKPPAYKKPRVTRRMARDQSANEVKERKELTSMLTSLQTGNGLGLMTESDEEREEARERRRKAAAASQMHRPHAHSAAPDAHAPHPRPSSALPHGAPLARPAMQYHQHQQQQQRAAAPHGLAPRHPMYLQHQHPHRQPPHQPRRG